MRITVSSKSLLLAAAGWAALTGAAAAQDAGQDRVVMMEEITVTGTPFGVTDRASLLAIDVLDEEELAVAPVATLGDLVAGVPGVRSSSFAPGASRPVIRGLSGPRVQVLTNGLGMIDASSVSPDHQVAIDPAEASRIEIVRGPSTLVFGGSAIGGVVNIIDDRVPATPAEGGLDGHVSTQASTVDNGYGVGARLKANAGSFVFSLDGFKRDSGDYDIPGSAMSQRLADNLGVARDEAGTVANSFAEIEQVGAGLSFIDDGGFAGVSVKTTDSTYGVVAEDEVTIQLRQTRYDFRAERDIHGGPFSRLRVGLGAADYQHTEFEGPDVGTTFTSNGYEGRVELIQTQRGGWQGVIGGQVLNRLFDAVGDEAYVPRTRIAETGVYSVQRYDRGQIGFEGGLRLDRRELNSLAADRVFDNISASMGAFVRPAHGLFVGLSLARNARAPTEVELFAAGPHVATGAFELGDADFHSEIAWSLEGTLHYDAGPLTLDLHPYGARYDGFIDIRPTGAVDADSGLPVFAYRQTDAEFYGLETEAAYALWQDGDRKLALEGQADYVHADTDLGPAARIPPWSATARLAWTSRRFDAALEARHVGGQDDVAAFELPTDSYTLVNLSGAVRPFRDSNVTVFAEVHNLADAEAREHASFLKDVAPLPGRNLRVGLTYRF